MTTEKAQPHEHLRGDRPGRGAAPEGLSESVPEAVDVINPRGPLVEKVFGWSLLLAVFVLARFLAVSWPRGAEAEESGSGAIRVAIQTAQHLLAHISISDLPAIIGAMLASEPLAALLLIATATVSLCLSSFPSVIFGDDLLGWRAMLMLFVSVVSVLGAVYLASWPWKALLLVAAIAVGWALASWWGRGTAVARWNRYGNALLRRSDGRGRDAEQRTGLSLEEDGETLTFRECAERLVARSAYVHDELKKRHDAFEDTRVADAYIEAMALRRVLALEEGARRRGQIVEPKRVEGSFKRRELFSRARHFVLAQGLSIAGVLIIIGLAITPTSWIAPTCMTDDEQSRTVYILSSSPPTVLVDATRTVETRTSWSGIELTTGECVADSTGV